MALHVHRAERTDLLADGLGALLTAPLDDPFEQEVVVVPARESGSETAAAREGVFLSTTSNTP